MNNHATEVLFYQNIYQKKNKKIFIESVDLHSSNKRHSKGKRQSLS